MHRSGKPVYAVLRMPRMVDYYMASAADKVYSSPEDMLLIQGLRLEVRPVDVGRLADGTQPIAEPPRD